LRRGLHAGFSSGRKGRNSLAGGKKFTIYVKNQAPENVYIQSVVLNGKPYNKSFLEHATILQGGEMEIVLGKSHNKNLVLNMNQAALSRFILALSSLARA
jgi:putative alpha-1,2-mannosidase